MAAHRLVWRFSSFPVAKVEQRPPFTAASARRIKIKMSAADSHSTRKRPILLFDIMDTIVRDPFYHHIPAFFGYSSSFFHIYCCLEQKNVL